MDGFISRYKYRSMESLLQMDKDWVIVCSQSLNHYVHCICGHRVKRITYLYHKPSKAIQYVGKTCVRKYGIEFYLTNPILLDVIKANLHRGEWDRDSSVRHHIHTQYTTFMTRVKDAALSDESSENIMNTVVGPFRRLLSDVCDLVSEYGFDLVDILRNIEEEVESLNQATRHQMVDEYSLCDTISEIASEHSVDSESMLFDTEQMEENIVVKECIEYLVEQVVEQGVQENVLDNVVIKENVEVEEGVQENVLDNVVIKENLVVEEVVEENIVVEESPTKDNSIIQNNFVSTIPKINKCHCFMMYCNCKMDYNLLRLHDRIDALSINIRNVRKDTDELVLKTRDLKILAKECLDKAIEISSKYNIHP